jgi:hypothetical protein
MERQHFAEKMLYHIDLDVDYLKKNYVHRRGNQRTPHRGLLRPVKNFQSFAVICRKPHVASSICLRATIFQNPEWTLWTHCTVTMEVLSEISWL